MLKTPEVTPEERAQLEAATERHLRRGELSEAWAALTKLSDAFPGDAAVAERIKHLEDSLEPSEWRKMTMTRPTTADAMKSPMHYAESLAAQGRYTEALELYRALLDENPHQELIKERLSELYQLARVASPKKQGVDRLGMLEHLLERISSRRRA